jgi:arginine decarboxylase-like protein
VRDAEWSTARSARLYRVEGWGAPYFGVNPHGHVTVRPCGGTAHPVRHEGTSISFHCGFPPCLVLNPN